MEMDRLELGEFSSIVCFKAVVTGAEEALGEKAAAITLIAAGRNRGKQLAAALGLTSANSSFDDILPALQKALGKEGTRLCLIDKIEQTDSSIKVYCRESICSAGEPEGSPRKLTFTMGAIQGVMEQFLGKRLRGKQIESVLRGSTHDVIEFEAIG